MPQQEIKDTFVARQALVERLVSLVRNQPEGAGVQHVVIVGPRGMGKTTLLLMIQLTVAEQGLTPPWQVIRFPEELYNVTDLAEFWLETARSLAFDAADAALTRQIAEIQARYTASDDLREASLALLKDWCRTHKRRLLLLVDNLSLLLSQINDERENASLRSVLMNDGFLMLIGAAPSIFREATGYDQALYNFFKIEHLESLSSAQTEDLLRRRAAADGIVDFDRTLRANRARFRVLEYFTGGNPRLVLMLYRVLAQSEVLEVRLGLEKLLDQVTPYYKDKMEILPPQQRKILDYIARESSRTHEGVTPSEIAKGARLAANVVSSQLKRLLESGYISTANLRGRNSYYTLAEPLYAIWYQMRFGRDARQRMGWLISFLKGWYDAEELVQESKRLKSQFRQQFDGGFVKEARETLEHRRYIMDAISDEAKQIGLLNEIIGDLLELKATPTLKQDFFSPLDIESLSLDKLVGLVNQGYIKSTDVTDIIKRGREAAELMHIFIENIRNRKFDDAHQNSHELISLLPNYSVSWHYQAFALRHLGRNEEALSSVNHALDLSPDEVQALHERGKILTQMGKYDEALIDLNLAMKHGDVDSEILCDHGHTSLEIQKYDEAVSSLEKAIQLKPENAQAWVHLSHALVFLGNYDKALDSIRQGILYSPDDLMLNVENFALLFQSGKYEEAKTSLERMQRIAGEQKVHVDIHVMIEGIQKQFPEWRKNAEELKERTSERDALLSLRLFATINDAGEDKNVKQSWLDTAIKGKKFDVWQKHAAEILTEIARGDPEKVRDWIISSQTEELFFPLLRAVDHIVSNDKALIEKLSPEMRGIVGEIVIKLRPDIEKTHAAN